MDSMMTVYHWILLTGFGICFVACCYHFLRIVFLGLPKDYSKPLGKVGPAIAYSLTAAMSPLKKETAYLHFPTYTAGILFHIGTFISMALLAVSFFYIALPEWIVYFATILLILSVLSGFGIFVKRVTKKSLKSLSNPDDYISNLLVTVFQLLSVVNLIWEIIPALYIWAAVLFLYIPVGKLRHTIYFFTSRIHLGYFYGWRGVWPYRRDVR